MNSKKKYTKIFNQVDIELVDMIEEFNATLNLIKEDKGLIRMRLLIAFSFLEVMCGIYNQYYNLGLADRRLLKQFMKNYCLNDKNQPYKNHHYLNKIDEYYLYNLRCSIVHAFALPEHKDEDKTCVLFINGDEEHEVIKEKDKEFSSQGFIPVFIDPDSLMRLFLRAGEMFFKEMKNKQENASKKDVDAISRVAKEFYRRGAKKIPI